MYNISYVVYALSSETALVAALWRTGRGQRSKRCVIQPPCVQPLRRLLLAGGPGLVTSVVSLAQPCLAVFADQCV